MKFRSLISISCVALFCVATPAAAQTDADKIAALVAQLEERIDSLERSNEALTSRLEQMDAAKQIAQPVPAHTLSAPATHYRKL